MPRFVAGQSCPTICVALLTLYDTPNNDANRRHATSVAESHEPASIVCMMRTAPERKVSSSIPESSVTHWVCRSPGPAPSYLLKIQNAAQAIAQCCRSRMHTGAQSLVPSSADIHARMHATICGKSSLADADLVTAFCQTRRCGAEGSRERRYLKRLRQIGQRK